MITEHGPNSWTIPPLSRALVPYVFGAAVLCVAAAIACVPPKGVPFDIPRYGGMLLAILAFAGVASSLWKAAQAAELFAVGRGYDGVGAVLRLNGAFWWLGLAAGVCAYVGFVVAQFNAHWFGPELGVAFASLGPLAWCASWSLAIWRLGPGSPDPSPVAIGEPLSANDVAAQALIERARETSTAPLLQQRHLPLIVAATTVCWLTTIVVMFVVPPMRGAAATPFLLIPALFGTMALWGMWTETLAGRDYWSVGNDLVYMHSWGMLRALRTLAVTGSIVIYMLWFASGEPWVRVAGIVIGMACAAYWVGMPIYLIRRFDRVDANG
jgi:hypothetical protein